MKRTLLFVIGLIHMTAAVALAGSLSQQSVSGQYTGAFAGGTGTFRLHTNGTYIFTFTASNMTATAKRFTECFEVRDGRVIDAKGTWDIDGRKIRFWNLPSAFDFQRAGFPTIHAEVLASWDSKRSRIVFPKEKDYWIQR